MARYSMQEADNYGSNGGGSYFSLKNDKDTARVRFLYGTIDDVEGDAVHEVEVDGKKRYVSCIRNYNDPIDACPLCKAQYKVIPKLFIKMYNVDTEETVVWERGKKYFERLASLASRYNPLYNEVIEIERNGKAGDMKTDYTFYPSENSEFDMSSIELPEPLGTMILDKSASEMEDYLATGSFTQGSQNVANQRISSRDEMPTGRRTPSNEGRRAF